MGQGGGGRDLEREPMQIGFKKLNVEKESTVERGGFFKRGLQVTRRSETVAIHMMLVVGGGV